MTEDAALAVDPGETVGGALALRDGERWRVESSWMLPQQPFLEWAEHYVAAWAPGTIVICCERFSITQRTLRSGRSDEFHAIETNGVMRFLTRKCRHPFVLQNPGDAKDFAPDARLREVGLYTPGPDHANDAARHAFLLLADRYGQVPPWIP